MRLEHINRRGERYYIFQGQTKTGKPKYFASKRATSEKGVPVDSLPAEFEVYESPANAIVTVRRRKPSRVLAAERNLVERLAIELSDCPSLQTTIDGDFIVIYTGSTGGQDLAEKLIQTFGFAARRAVESMRQSAHLTPEMRFKLTDADQREYIAQRYCHRSSLNDWLYLDGPAPLEPLAKKLVPHLGQESLYELF